MAIATPNPTTMDESVGSQLQQDARNTNADAASNYGGFEEQAPPRDSTTSPISTRVVTERLEPTGLSIYQFGSRFIPHSATPITSLLPLLDDRFILIGDMDGLGVLDVFPSKSSLSVEDPSISHALEGTTRRDLWTGEAYVYLL